MFFLIIIICPLFISGQEKKEIKYKTFSAPLEDVSLIAPEEFDLVYGDEKRNSSRLYGYYSPDFYLFVKSDKESDKELFKTLKNLAKEKIAEVTELTVGNLKLEKYLYIDAEDFYQTILIVPLNDRQLIFRAVSTEKENPAVEKFFSSLKFGSYSMSAAKVESVKSSKINAGTNFEIGKDTNPPLPKAPVADKDSIGKTTGIKILSKPLPGYTDLAREYGIQGTVRLRMTFRLDGKIGSVAVVNKIPFGLTIKAIEAAKKIEFEPPFRKGVPYTVSKLVEFSFTIY